MDLRVVFAAAEAYPLAKAGGLGDVAGSLPKALAHLGEEITLMLPRYGWLEGDPLAGASFEVPMGKSREPATLREEHLPPGIRTLLIDHPGYFDRRQIYGYHDDALRFAFFSRAVLEACRHADLRPDILHCHDWHTALIPAYLRAHYTGDPHLAKTRVVLTIHNLEHQGRVPASLLRQVDLPRSFAPRTRRWLRSRGNFLRAGLRWADAVTTVSPTYAREIQTPDLGEGLSRDLRRRGTALSGILNGLDLEVWDPRGDPFLAHPFDPLDSEGKATNKRALQQEVGLPEEETPLLGFVARLVPQKGISLLLAILSELVDRSTQLVVLGTGKTEYETALRKWVGQSRRLSLHLTYDEALAHRIYAGSDLFLMPSQFEPCGLGQMISMRYGTVPLARRTGGLADTVVDVEEDVARATGFTFDAYRPEAFLAAIDRALDAYHSEAWRTVVANGVRQDFSWDRSARRYRDLFRQLTSSREPLPEGGGPRLREERS